MDSYGIRYELVLSSMRILNLLNSFKGLNNYSMSFDRIILYDFFMRFPKTMIPDKKETNQFDFEELYSFYHTHPDRENYSRVLNYLLSKNLIDKQILLGSFSYSITDEGTTIISEIDNPFAEQMRENAIYIRQKFSRISETKMREDIYTKSLENIKKI